MRTSHVALISTLLLLPLAASHVPPASVEGPTALLPRDPLSAPSFLLDRELPAWRASAGAAAQSGAGSGDCGSGRDASQASPVEVAFPLSCDGRLATTAKFVDADYYAFETDGDQVLDVEISESLLLAIFRPGEDRYWYAQWGRLTTRVPAGPLVLAVSDPFGYEHDYALTASLSAFTDVPDCHLDGDSDTAPMWAEETIEDGALIPTSAACEGHLEPGDVRDVYRVTLPPQATLQVTLERTAGTDVVGASIQHEDWVVNPLTRANWRGVAAVWDGPQYASTMNLTDDAGGEWVLILAKTEPGRGSLSYRLTFATTLRAPGDDCGGSGDSASPARLADRAVAPGAVCAGTLVRGDVGDAFDLQVPPEGGRVRLRATQGAPTDILLFAQNEEGHFFDTTYNYTGFVDPAWTPPVRTWTNLYVAGDETSLRAAPVSYAWLFKEDEPASLPYAFSYEFLPDDQDDCGFGRDAPARRGTAAPLVAPSPATCRGRVPQGDSADWYRVPGAPGDLLDIHLSGEFGFPSYVEEWQGGRSYDEFQIWFQEWSFSGRLQGPFALKVGGHWGPNGYDLHVDHARRETLDDCGSGDDADAEWGNEVRVQPIQSCPGAFTNHADLVDDYVLEASSLESIAILLDPLLPVRVRLTMTAPDGAVLFDGHPGDLSLIGKGFWILQAPGDGDYRLRFEAESPATYRLNVVTLPAV